MFVKRHEHSLLFDQAFRIFFAAAATLDQLMAMMLPQAPNTLPRAPPEAGRHARARSFVLRPRRLQAEKEREIEVDTRLSVSEREVLQKRTLRR